MRGLLADINVQGHLPHLQHLIRAAGLWEFVAEVGAEFATFPDAGLDRRAPDRLIWEVCQRDGWVLFTENRNNDGADSLQAVIEEQWRGGLLPVLTLANVGRLVRDRGYGLAVARQVAELLYGLQTSDDYRDRPRLYVPAKPVG